MNKLLVIGYVWPEPNSSAAGGHMLDILRFFVKRGWDVTFASPAQLSPHQYDLAHLGIKQQEIKLNCDSFNHFVRTLSPQLVLFDRFMMEEQFGWRVAKEQPTAIRILESSDLHLLRHARQLAQKNQQGDYTPYLTSEMALREIAAIYRCDLTLIISEFEMGLLQEHFQIPRQLLHYLPLLVDEAALQPRLGGYQQRHHFITIGNFRHPPNWDSVLWLHQQIWPAIRRAIPDSELHIYGAYPPKKATQLNSPANGFLVKGWAESSIEVLQQARVMLAPLRFGAGQKGKLLDAMLAGTPSITTTIGAEGMAGDLPWGGTVADDNQAIIDAAIALYQTPSLWDEKQQHGFEIVQQRFSSQPHLTAFESRLEQLSQHIEQERNNNFVGRMLNHHHHKSTQYMSLWIEEKNRPR